MKTWIVVADASRARIFETSAASGELKEVVSLIHPASRLKTSELVSDRPGRVSRGSGRSAMQARTGAHEVEADSFAASLAEGLDKGVERGECGTIVLVVPPRFLGRLRSVISHRVLSAVSKTVQKDLTQYSTQEVSAALAEHLAAPANLWR